jgi:subtilisin family serine protease
MSSDTRRTGRPRPRASSFAAAALAAALALGAGGAGAAPPQMSSEGPWAKGRVIVMPKAGLSDQELGRIVGAQGGKATRMGGSRLYVVELPPQVSERAVAAQLAHNPHLKFAELDHAVPASLVPNDPYLGSAWHHTTIASFGAWSTTLGTNVTVAIIDSGIDSAHPDLSGRLVAGWNFFDNNSNTADVFGHGTKVAGGASAATNNGIGVAAVAGESKVMPLRVTDTSGSGYISLISNAIVYAADRGVRVANVSFRNMPGYSSVISAAQYMKDKNGLVFVAAGNTGSDLGHAATSSMIPVAATAKGDVRWSSSSFGKYVMLAAPGVSVYTIARGGGYGAVTGTSIASPVAAGVAALLMSANPGLRSADVEKILFSTAADLGTAGWDPYFGHGRVDASRAMQLALDTKSPTPDTQAPTVAISSPAASATVSGLAVVDVAASDDVGVSKVELWVNGALHSTDASAPFGFSWDTTKVPNGSASLVAKAVDAAGNASASSTVTVNVSNASTLVTDTTPPSAAITNPSDGATLGATTLKVVGQGSDNAGVSGLTLELQINGSRVASTKGTGTLEYSWNTRKLKAGTNYTLTLLATDAAGNRTVKSVKVYR